MSNEIWVYGFGNGAQMTNLLSYGPALVADYHSVNDINFEYGKLMYFMHGRAQGAKQVRLLGRFKLKNELRK